MNSWTVIKLGEEKTYILTWVQCIAIAQLALFAPYSDKNALHVNSS